MKLSMLNMMVGDDFATALDRHVNLGIEILDLKESILGRAVEDLTVEDAREASRMLTERSLSVYCLSSQLGYRPLEMGEEKWIAEAFDCLDRILAVAHVLQPEVVRLLCASSPTSTGQSFMQVAAKHPWLVPAYRTIASRIAAEGFTPMAENEAVNCIVANPHDAVAFVEAVRGDSGLRFIWDVQNMWQMGTYPDLAVLDVLRPVTAGLHLKGGIADAKGELETASTLEDASWPVREIVNAVIASGSVAVICLNPSHGNRPPGYTMAAAVEADIRFLRRAFPTLTQSSSNAAPA